MNKKFIRFSAIALLFAMNTYAQDQEPKQLDEVVVSDSKFALPKEKSGKVIVKITAEDLKKKSGQSIEIIQEKYEIRFKRIFGIAKRRW